MTARYLGMNRSDGLTVTDLEHISQSIGDILRTPVGSRVMRRDYGSLLASMIDQPQTPALELQIKVACYMAVLKWEPRVTLSSVTTARSFDGRMIVTLTGQHNDTGHRWLYSGDQLLCWLSGLSASYGTGWPLLCGPE